MTRNAREASSGAAARTLRRAPPAPPAAIRRSRTTRLQHPSPLPRGCQLGTPVSDAPKGTCASSLGDCGAGFSWEALVALAGAGQPFPGMAPWPRGPSSVPGESTSRRAALPLPRPLGLIFFSCCEYRCDSWSCGSNLMVMRPKQL